MKRRFLPLLTAGLLAPVLCACQKELLPVPDYPLNLGTAEQELAEWGLDCTIEAVPTINKYGMELSTFRVFSAANDELVCTIDSGLRNGQRMLHISFRYSNLPDALSPEDCEEVLAFAAGLFGGFEGAGRVHEIFLKEYDKTNTGRIKTNTYKSDSSFTLGTTARWGRLIDGIACQIILVQPDIEAPQEFIWQVIISSDWDEFYPERRL